MLIFKKIQTICQDKAFLISLLISFIAYIPIIALPLYSIDDYFLFQTYSINSNTLGYNFYGTGRFAQSIIADIGYYLNIQPITKPIGPIFLIISLVLLGRALIKELNLKSKFVTSAFLILFTLNPFFYELFSYSIVSFYSAFSVFFLYLGFLFSAQYAENKKLSCLILAISFFIFSLMVYQIFYPIIFVYMSMLFCFNYLNIGNTVENKKLLRIALPYFFGFVLYSILIKLFFVLISPSMAYFSPINGELLSRFLTAGFWESIGKNIIKFIFSNNAFNSKYINLFLLSVTTFLYFFSLIYKKSASLVTIYKSIFFILSNFLFLILLLGFSLINPDLISARFLTSFGLYQLLLYFFCYFILQKNFRFSAFIGLFNLFLILLILANASRIGRLAFDQYRLNQIDNSLAQRIVARLENHEKFKPDAKVIIIGSTNYGAISRTHIGDYNAPALSNFSRVFVLNEISGYSFQNPSQDEISGARKYSTFMESWPNVKSIQYIDNFFIIKLN